MVKISWVKCSKLKKKTLVLMYRQRGYLICLFHIVFQKRNFVCIMYHTDNLLPLGLWQITILFDKTPRLANVSIWGCRKTLKDFSFPGQGHIFFWGGKCSGTPCWQIQKTFISFYIHAYVCWGDIFRQAKIKLCPFTTAAEQTCTKLRS